MMPQKETLRVGEGDSDLCQDWGEGDESCFRVSLVTLSGVGFGPKLGSYRGAYKVATATAGGGIDRSSWASQPDLCGQCQEAQT